MWVRCIFVNVRITAHRPCLKPYPATFATLGDHIRKTRLNRDLSQPRVAKIIGVSADTICTWELNRHKPQTRYYDLIYNFIGYKLEIS